MAGQPRHLHGRQYHTGDQLPVVRGQESLFESCVVAGLIVAVIVVKAPPGQACLLLALCPLRPETVMQPLLQGGGIERRRADGRRRRADVDAGRRERNGRDRRPAGLVTDNQWVTS